jgi:hypothetical protein
VTRVRAKPLVAPPELLSVASSPGALRVPSNCPSIWSSQVELAGPPALSSPPVATIKMRDCSFRLIVADAQRRSVKEVGLQSPALAPTTGANLCALSVVSEIYRPVSVFGLTSIALTAFRFLRSMLLIELLVIS